MEHDSTTKAILEKTRELINLFNQKFAKKLKSTIDREYIRGGAEYYDGAEYYEAVLKKMLHHGYLRFKEQPSIGFNTYWYENADGNLWFHEIPAVLTKSGQDIVVSCGIEGMKR